MRMRLLLLFVVVVLAISCANGNRVAVIGAGAGGVSAARFLHESMGDEVEIHVFERSDHIGGRVCTGVVDGKSTELGGSVYHVANRLFGTWVEEAGLESYNPTKEYSDAEMGCSSEVGRERELELLGVWNGSEFTFIESEYWIVSMAKALWRYGLGPFYVRAAANDALERFLNVYTFLDDDSTVFETVEEVLDGIGMRNLTSITLAEHLHGNGWCGWTGGAYCHEIAAGMTRVNYAQAPEHMNALVGEIALIGSTEDLRAVRGGNYRAIEHSLLASQAIVHKNTEVRGVAFDATEDTYTLKGEGGETLQDMSFDAVVLATPLEHTNIEFSALQLPGESEGMRKREYMLTHVTFVVGELRLDDYFGLEEGAKQPNNIITPETDAVDFTSIFIHSQYEVEGERRTRYKLFSRHEMSDDTLARIFNTGSARTSPDAPPIVDERVEIFRTKFYAYPKLPPLREGALFPPFNLHKNSLFYVNALESAFSTIETEIISGRNVAKLVARSLRTK